MKYSKSKIQYPQDLLHCPLSPGPFGGPLGKCHASAFMYLIEKHRFLLDAQLDHDITFVLLYV